ncbi:MAG: hypothetical protein BRD39_01115 [Bacteroidetes bacterium QH_9_64_21]|nr:MAG: hypothetical protein BRD39_01115 [Bacteroidetes bacterium QH_9_64_21]
MNPPASQTADFLRETRVEVVDRLGDAAGAVAYRTVWTAVLGYYFEINPPTKSAPQSPTVRSGSSPPGLIAVDLTLFVFPVVPVLATYVLVVRPPWFKDFVNDAYDR